MPAFISPEDQQFIERAAHYLERPGFLIRLANLLGQPLEAFTSKVPERVHVEVENALKKAMDLAVRTIPSKATGEREHQEASTAAYWSGLRHTLATAATGATSGFFGMPGLAVELPISTGLMFRSIARIAGDFGEDLSKPEIRLECMSIFSYGGPTKEDDALESSYLSTRLGLTIAIQQAAQVITRTSAEDLISLIGRGAAPALVRLIGQIAGRFNIIVSEKFIAQSLPVVGALGGALVNVAFSDHFNTVARYHFGLRRLERHYGTETVQDAYRQAVQQVKAETRPQLEQRKAVT